jgi:pimeloyl-ACP methyl ester carboxylesterase
VTKCVFVGFSWGASVGCWLGASHPDRALAVVLVEGGHLEFADLPGFRTDRNLDEFVSEAEAAALSEGAAFGTHSPAAAGAMVHGLCREPTTTAYPRLAASGVPVLFIGARRDESSFALQRLSRLVPQTEIIELDSPGHDLLRDAPGDVARELGRWLAGLAPPASG